LPNTASMKNLKIFLASSYELRSDREKFEISIGRKNKLWKDKNVSLDLCVWEDLSGRMSSTRSQDEYNDKIKESDLFVLLAYTKVGEYTNEEFEIAFESFKKSKRPFIYTYFKNIDFNADISLKEFQAKLKKMGHFYNTYHNYDNLWNQFNNELDRLSVANFNIINIEEQKHSDTQKTENPILETIKNISEIAKNISTQKKEKNQVKEHNPQNIFGKWQLIKLTQNNHNLIIPLEVIIFYPNMTFRLFQNNIQTNFGNFNFNGSSLNLVLFNGFNDQRTFYCRGNQLRVAQNAYNRLAFYQRVN